MKFPVLRSEVKVPGGVGVNYKAGLVQYLAWHPKVERSATSEAKGKENMKLSDQVCSLELAKRLKELGVKQESHFYWSQLGQLLNPIDGNKNLNVLCSAFNVVELGEMLPQLLPIKKHEHHFGRLTLWRVNDNWQLAYNLESKQFFEIDSWDKSMANAFAKMLIHLIENKITAFPKLNL